MQPGDRARGFHGHPQPVLLREVLRQGLLHEGGLRERGTLTLFQAICEAFDPNAKGIEGRFHHHMKHVTHAITAVHHLRKSTNSTKKLKKEIAFDRRQTILLNPVVKKSKITDKAHENETKIVTEDTSTKGNKKNV